MQLLNLTVERNICDASYRKLYHHFLEIYNIIQTQ